MEIPKKLRDKMYRAKKITNLLRKLTKEIDEEMSIMGYDVDALRHNDAAGYVDMIDYGIGIFDVVEGKKFKTKE